MQRADALFVIAAAKKEAVAAVEAERLSLIGKEGSQGKAGERGPQGERGPIGARGLQGMQGPQGPRGPKGEQGPKGETGQQGPKGDNGKDGRDGKDGVGVASVEIDDGILTISLTDGRAFSGDVRGPRGPKGERGPKGDRRGDTIAWVSGGGGGGSALAWDDFATRWDIAPTLAGSTDAGTVYSYTLEGVTRYRLVPDPYVASLDAFYETFSGGVLSGLIVARGA